MLSSSFPTLVYHFHGVAAVLGLTLVFGPPVQAAPSSCACRKLWGGRGTPMPVPKAPTAPSCCCGESEEDLEKGIPRVLCPSNSGTERCLISPARSLWLSPIPGGSQAPYDLLSHRGWGAQHLPRPDPMALWGPLGTPGPWPHECHRHRHGL